MQHRLSVIILGHAYILHIHTEYIHTPMHSFISFSIGISSLNRDDHLCINYYRRCYDIMLDLRKYLMYLSVRWHSIICQFAEVQ